ncbi:hypothetical protein VU08_08035 [Desulfobulbus sp. F5]|nr:hypothetical protein [Desulfobulbus sp. F5]
MTDTASVRSCWMCGAPADSREHKFKKSDIVRRYGAQPFKEMGGVVHCRHSEKKYKDIQGASAKVLTYNPIICSRCNNVVSQPWDQAYQQFESWLFNNSSVILQRRFILLEEVFGTDMFWKAPALYKYFVKAFGCRLANTDQQIPSDIVELLPLDYFETGWRWAFAVNKSLFAMSDSYREGFLGLGDLVRIDSRVYGKMEGYVWHMQIGWLRIHFFYNEPVPPGLGAPWTSDSACLYLGEFEPITIDEQIELIRTGGSASEISRIEAMRDNGGFKVE